MNKTFSVEQLAKSDNLDFNLIFRHYKLILIARLMEIKSPNPKLRQGQTAKELGCSTST